MDYNYLMMILAVSGIILLALMITIIIFLFFGRPSDWFKEKK